MTADVYPLQVLLVTLTGWVNRHQQHVIEYLVEENRVLKEQVKGRRLRLTDDQPRRLAAKGRRLGQAHDPHRPAQQPRPVATAESSELDQRRCPVVSMDLPPPGALHLPRHAASVRTSIPFVHPGAA